MFKNRQFKELSDYIRRVCARGPALEPFIRSVRRGPDFIYIVSTNLDRLTGRRLDKTRRQARSVLLDALGPAYAYSYAASAAPQSEVKLWAVTDMEVTRIAICDPAKNRACVIDTDRAFGRKHNWYRMLGSIG